MKKTTVKSQPKLSPKPHKDTGFEISVDISNQQRLDNHLILTSKIISHKSSKEKKVKDVKISKNVKSKERKAKRIINHKKKGSGTTNHNHKKKLKQFHDTVEVTTCAVDVLESKSDLDEQYVALKQKVLAALPQPETLIHINHSTTLEERINSIFDNNSELNTLYLVDLSTVIIKYKDWINILPNVQPFYAMKCNPDDKIVSTLVACGAGLDCASMHEMKVALSKGLDGTKIIFANPCKMPAHIKFAKENGIEMMTFDNKAELLKVHEIFPSAKMVLRILGDDSHSTMRFGSKFGANVQTEARGLLEYAYSLGLQVIGVSFHVGSGCQSAEAYTNSLRLARHVFDLAEELGHTMTFLDIGGGTPGVDTADLQFAEIAKTVSQNLKEMFSPNVRVIAEPGRYFASECVVLVTSVIAKRERIIPHNQEDELNPEESQKQIDYYISDGVYGSFNNLFFDHANAQPVPMQRKKNHLFYEGNPEGSTDVPNVEHHSNDENHHHEEYHEHNDSLLDSPPNNNEELVFGSPPNEQAFGSPPKDLLCGSPPNNANGTTPNGSPPNESLICSPKSRSTVFGPTCDSIDLICKDVELPDLEIGDIVYFFNMGAYTSAAASSFNGFNPPETVFMIS